MFVLKWFSRDNYCFIFLFIFCLAIPNTQKKFFFLIFTKYLKKDIFYKHLNLKPFSLTNEKTYNQNQPGQATQLTHLQHQRQTPTINLQRNHSIQNTIPN